MAKTSVALVVCTVFSTPIIFAAGLAARSEYGDGRRRRGRRRLPVRRSALSTWCLCSFAATWRRRGHRRRPLRHTPVNACATSVGASSAALCPSRPARRVPPSSRSRGWRPAARPPAERCCPRTARSAAVGAAHRRRRRQDLGLRRSGFFGVRVCGPGARRGHGGRSRRGTARDRCGVAFGAPQDALFVYMLARAGAALNRPAARATARTGVMPRIRTSRRSPPTRKASRRRSGATRRGPHGRRARASRRRSATACFCSSCCTRPWLLSPRRRRPRSPRAGWPPQAFPRPGERTASSLMGAFLFLIFGLAKDQVLVRHISDAVARLREPRSPTPRLQASPAMVLNLILCSLPTRSAAAMSKLSWPPLARSLLSSGAASASLTKRRSSRRSPSTPLVDRLPRALHSDGRRHRRDLLDHVVSKRNPTEADEEAELHLDRLVIAPCPPRT